MPSLKMGCCDACNKQVLNLLRAGDNKLCLACANRAFMAYLDKTPNTAQAERYVTVIDEARDFTPEELEKAKQRFPEKNKMRKTPLNTK